MVYNPLNDLDFYSQNFALILGTWHPYKLATENLYYKFLGTFLGPAFHALCPDYKIYVKPKLSQLENFFSMLSCAYPYFRPLLMMAFRRANGQNQFDSDLQNLHDFFEFFLPLVCLVVICEVSFKCFYYVIPCMLIISFQVRDYGIEIKSGSLDQIVTAFLDLLMVMVCTGSTQYVRCMCLQMCLFQHWESTKHPVFSLIRRFPQNLLEEDGEISLSLLCHAATVHGVHYDHKHLGNLYKLTNLYRQNAAEATIDLGIRVSRRKHHRVSCQDPEVAVLVTHFRRTIIKMVRGSWTHYPEIARSTRRYPTLERMTPRLVNTSLPRVRLDNFTDAIRTGLKDIRRLLGPENTSFWIPEESMSSFSMSSDSSETSDDDSFESSSSFSVSQTGVFQNFRSASFSVEDELSSSSEEEIVLARHVQPPTQESSSHSFSHSSSSELSTASSHQYLQDPYHILCILDKRTRRRTLPDGTFEIVCEYLVHWRYFPSEENDTWELEQTLRQDCPNILAEYENQQESNSRFDL